MAPLLTPSAIMGLRDAGDLGEFMAGRGTNKLNVVFVMFIVTNALDSEFETTEFLDNFIYIWLDVQ